MISAYRILALPCEQGANIRVDVTIGCRGRWGHGPIVAGTSGAQFVLLRRWGALSGSVASRRNLGLPSRQLSSDWLVETCVNISLDLVGRDLSLAHLLELSCEGVGIAWLGFGVVRAPARVLPGVGEPILQAPR